MNIIKSSKTIVLSAVIGCLAMEGFGQAKGYADVNCINLYCEIHGA